MSKRPVIVWFRRDLRLADNSSLDSAAESGRPLICVYVLDERDTHCWDTGGASRWWLHQSLASLDRDLHCLGGRLILRRGDTAEELRKLVGQTAAERLVFSRFSGPESALLEEAVARRLADTVEVDAFCNHLLHEPGSIRTAAGDPYRIFTPFWRAARSLPDPGLPPGPPTDLRFAVQQPESERLADWQLTPTAPDWAGGLRQAWSPGEASAHNRVQSLVNDMDRYARERDRPDHDGTSRLSPHLHFGELSPRQLWHAARQAGDTLGEGIQAFLRQLYWREFSYHLLHAFVDLPTAPLRQEFAHFPWQRDRNLLAAWQRGETGYPIVDAGMRELLQTGWMHNRVRMLAASFLVKHLLIPWQDGAAWFRETLVDADEANNSASWQWVAGCGTDAAPYFRIFNPISQGKKFDPQGRYTKRWIPELSKLDAAYIHAPWEAPADALRDAGVRPGQTYPAPVVEHRFARERALAAFKQLKSS